MKKILGWMFNRWTLTALGLLALCLLIWFGGPLLAFADYRPLESATMRWIVIALIFGAYLGRLAWRAIKSKMNNARLFDSLAKQAPAPARNVVGAEEVAVLGGRFEDAMKILKEARLGGDGKSAGFFSRLTKRFVYELPWYIFIGAPGSGKTTALRHSGLKFPLAERFGNDSIQGVGGTRNCDWWFTDQAVLIDTAGRYTTHEANAEADRAAWNGFLALLKKFRPRRPINGILLTVSVPDLLQQSAAQRDTHAGILRQRVEELHQELGIRFPIYVLVTKADLLAGFSEFYEKFGADERAQVWGVSFPHNEDKAAPPAVASFKAEFTALEKRLNERVLDLVQGERNVQARAAIYAFPQQFSSVKEVLNEFIGKVFAPSRFVEKPMLRGVYFTSGTQEGTAIDRVMGNMGRAMRLQPGQFAPQQPGGKSFFLTRLLDGVIFNEAGLAGANLRWERRRSQIQWIGLGTAAACAVVGIGLWTVSYLRNKEYVAAVQAQTPPVAKQVADLKVKGESEVLTLLPVLEAVRNLPAPSGTQSGGLLTGLGLSQEDTLTGAANSAYGRVLRGAFLPRIAQRIESQLRSRDRRNVEFLYETLKAYIMLHDPQRFDAGALQAYIEADWERQLPQDVPKEQRAALSDHLATLFKQGVVASALPPDENLLAEIRAELSRMPLAERVYSRLKRLGIGRDQPEFTLASGAGASAAVVFARASGKPLNKGVPGMFSYQAYYGSFRKDSEAVANQLAGEEGWVLGLSAADSRQQTDAKAREILTNEVRRLYLTDYADTWAAFVDDIRLVRGGGLMQTITQARVLAAADSPLRKLLQAIVKEVTLVKTDEADKTVVDKGRDLIDKTKKQVGDLIGAPQRAPGPTAAMLARPELIVDDRFNALREYVKGAGGGQPAPLDGTLALIGELYNHMNAVKIALDAKNPPPGTDLPVKAKSAAGQLPSPVKELLATLSQASQSLSSEGQRQNLGALLRAEVTDFCTKAISGRYPFANGSTRNVTQEDFARIFGAGGTMDAFFNKHLVTLVDTSTRPWRFRQVGDVSMGDAGALAQFQRAQTIRDVFFRGGANASLRLDFKPLSMDTTISQFVLDVDGQIVKYSHGPQVPQPVQWPGPRGSTQVRIQLTPPATGGGLGPFEGHWALFRMFDQIKIEQTPQPEKFVATFTIDGRNAQFEITASSVRNPIRLPELEQFQCPGAL